MNNSERYYKIGEFAKAIGKSENTLREWEKVGKLVPQRTQGNHRVYSETQRIKVLQEELERKKIVSGKHTVDNSAEINSSKVDQIESEVKSDRKIVAYARSTKDSTIEDIEYQVNLLKVYMAAKGYSFQIYKDIGNGINFKNTALESLLELVINGEIERIVILSKDALSKFNSEIIEMLCRSFNTEIEVIDKTPEIDIEKLNKEVLDFIESLNTKD